MANADLFLSLSRAAAQGPSWLLGATHPSPLAWSSGGTAAAGAAPGPSPQHSPAEVGGGCQRSAEQPGNNLDQPCLGCQPVSTASSDLSPAGEVSRALGAFHGLLLAARRSRLDQRKFVVQTQIRRNGRLLFLRNLFGSRAGTPVLN